ncbi:hypothetical protein [uncultured Lactobacillus sp.]|uniref:hypothetical protein n=1 Tax=uncultured Lactobacillus sp. TaxID=153152 RepID=UPI002632E958|nr:hypothetical protein [uncultured Lactobacillus sp.]
MKISKETYDVNDAFVNAVENDNISKAKKCVKKMAAMHNQSIEKELAELYFAGYVVYGPNSKVCKVISQMFSF